MAFEEKQVGQGVSEEKKNHEKTVTIFVNGQKKK